MNEDANGQSPATSGPLPDDDHFLLAIHRRLLPDRPDIGWTPYLWLCYLGYFFVGWFREPPSPAILAASAVTMLVFLALYFNGYWRAGLPILWNTAGVLMLGLLWIPLNPSAMVFFIYAAGFTGAVGPPKIGRWTLIAISAIVLAYGAFLGMSWLWMLSTVMMSWIVGATNIYYAEMSRKNADLRRTQEEAEQLATIAERERIARDLHDLLGHTLSLITIKAELARKLSERGDDRAVTEIADVERISREALRQVRQAVEGYRESGLAGELARARIVCEARDIELDTRAAPVQLAPVHLETRQEAALAMVLREAMTNVARHSFASQCEISFRVDSSEAVLSITDNGRGGKDSEALSMGNGLTGMRERLSQLDGELTVRAKKGWRLEARLPIKVKRRTQSTTQSAEETDSELPQLPGARLAAEGA